MSKSPEKCGKKESDGCNESVVNPAKPAYNACVSPIKPVGNKRPASVADGKEIPYPAVLAIETLDKIEWESTSDEIMAEEDIREVINIAKKNPLTNDAIEQAKLFTEINKEEIHKQCLDLVALYNISTRKPFFYITPYEARVAIDYIKKVRNGYTEEMNLQGLKDAFVHKFISALNNLTDNPEIELQDWDECIEDQTKNEGHDLKEYDKIDKDLSRVVGESDISAFSSVVDASIDIYKDSDDFELKKSKSYYVYNFNFSGDLVTGITLGFINQMFAQLESRDLMVDVMIMNSRRVSDIRGFGKFVHDEYSLSEQKKRRCFGSLFTSEIYPCNRLSDNQIVFGSLIELNGKYDHGVFLNVMF